MKVRPYIFKGALGLASVTALVGTTACSTPQVAALVQRTSCNSEHVKPATDACTHWVNTLPAYGYSAGTEWVGPYSDFAHDKYYNGAVELP